MWLVVWNFCTSKLSPQALGWRPAQEVCVFRSAFLPCCPKMLRLKCRRKPETLESNNLMLDGWFFLFFSCFWTWPPTFETPTDMINLLPSSAVFVSPMTAKWEVDSNLEHSIALLFIIYLRVSQFASLWLLILCTHKHIFVSIYVCI